MELDILESSLFWRLEPIYNSFVKLFIKTIKKLKMVEDNGNVAYIFQNRPIINVEIFGYVISKKERNNFIELISNLILNF